MKSYRFNVFCIAFLAPFALLTFVSCNKKFLMEKLNEPHIAFGSGGGFTNLVKQYHLLEDGKIIAQTKLKDSTQYTIVAEIGKRKAKECFTAANNLNLDSLKFSEPGNLYYFISVKGKEALAENRIVWGSKDKPVPPEVQDFYKTLLAFLIKPKTQ